MQSLHKLSFALAVAVLATSGGLMAAEAAPSGAATKAAAMESARKGTVDLQKLIAEISTQRERMIADHDALAKRLKDATESERKVIMDRMGEQKKAFEAAQSVLHKSIRDEQRRMRQNAGSNRR